MPKVDVLNLIQYLAGKTKAPESLNGVTPKHAAERIRKSCAQRGKDYGEWSGGILQHCIIPSGHPLKAMLNKRKVPVGDPLWVLGAIAYGTQSPWIVFRRVVWADGKVELPDDLERKWITGNWKDAAY